MFSLHNPYIACVGGVTASMVAFQAIDPGSTPRSTQIILHDLLVQNILHKKSHRRV